MSSCCCFFSRREEAVILDAEVAGGDAHDVLQCSSAFADTACSAFPQSYALWLGTSKVYTRIDAVNSDFASQKLPSTPEIRQVFLCI